MTVVIVIVVVVVLLIIIGAAMYNGLVRLNQQASEAWSDITVQLKRRADLIPNLVNTVKGYASHEKSVFEDVTAARANTLSAQTPGEAAKAEGDFQKTMKSLFAVAENYPDLKASQNFQELQTELTDTEDKIQASRRFYNGVVRDFNTKRKTFPTSVFAGMLGFRQDKEFFEVDEAEAAAVQKPVDVKF
jgi:LemA protein